MINELNTFTFSVYNDLLKYLKTKWEIVTFIDAHKKVPTNPYGLLRHDVDTFTDSILKMAKIENRENIKSTYFFLCSSSIYNVRDPEVVDVIKEISSMGHDIGLHYDSNIYKKYSREILDGLNTEVCNLEEVTGIQVESISCHNPGESEPILDSQFIEVYEDIYFDCYVSDSCHIWNKGLIKLFSEPLPHAVHLLVHPPIWAEQCMDTDEIADKIFNFAIDRLIAEKEHRLIGWRKKHG